MRVAAENVAEVLAELRQRRDLQLLGNDEVAQRRLVPIPTGLEALDALLGGGLPQGRLVELAPGPGGAATAIAVRLLAQLTANKHPVALVDRADAFDAQSAERAGVDLKLLLWCQPKTIRDALRATDAIVSGAAFPLVVLDLGARPPSTQPQRSRERIADAAWLRLSRRVELARIAFVVLAEAGQGPGAFSSATLVPERARAKWEGRGPGRTFEALEVRLALARNKLGLPVGTADLTLLAPRATFRVER